jgi:hypothetical protein
MNIFFQFFATLLLGFAAEHFLPWWWTLAPAAFAIGLFFRHKHSGFPALIGFFSGFILWWGMAFYMSVQNHDLLAGRMGQLFGGLSPTALQIAAGALGGVLAALGAMTANLARKMIKQTQ